MTPWAPPARTEPAATGALRGFATGLAVVGLLAAMSVHILGAYGVVCAVLVAAGSYASHQVTDERTAKLLRAAGGAIIVTGMVVVYTRLRHVGLEPQQLPSAVAPMVATVVWAQALTQRTRRDTMVGVSLAQAQLALAAAASPSAGIVVFAVVGLVLSALVLAASTQLLAPLGTAVRHSAVTSSAHHPRCPPDCDLPHRGELVHAPVRDDRTHRVRGLPALPWTRIGAAAGAALLLGLAVFVVLPPPNQDRARRLLPQGALAEGSGKQEPGQARGPSRSGGTTAYTSGPLDMRLRGDLPNTPALRVEGGDPGLRRGTVLTDYSDGVWYPPDPTGRAVVPPGRPQPLGAGERPQQAEPQHAERVTFLGPLRGNELVYSQGAALEVDQQTLPTTPLTALVGSQSYRVISVATSSSADLLRSAAVYPSGPESGLPAADLAAATSVPEEIRSELLPLVTPLTAGRSTRYDVVTAVIDDLHRRAKYRLDAPVPGPGVDPVLDFLFTSHEGFCEMFAAATVLELRSVGIPARMAAGFAGGTQQADGSLQVNSNEAHAWVEVWMPDTGWWAVDPTAGSTLAEARAKTDGTSWLARLWAWVLAHLVLVVAAVLLLAVVALGIWLARRRGRSPGHDAEPLATPLPPATAAFLRLDAALRAADSGPVQRPLAHGRLPSETLRDVALRLPAAGLPDLTAALQVVERELYAEPSPPSPWAVQAAVADLDAATRRLHDADQLAAAPG